jgi:hyperosmotically inducible protein
MRDIRRVLALVAITAIVIVASACGKAVGDSIDDAGITAQVKTVLLNDKEIGALRIDVDTTQGVVTLSGPVRSNADEERAIQLARQVAGVKDVKSTLQIQP